MDLEDCIEYIEDWICYDRSLPMDDARALQRALQALNVEYKLREMIEEVE